MATNSGVPVSWSLSLFPADRSLPPAHGPDGRYRVRLYSRGYLDEPLPVELQPVVLDEVHVGHWGTLAEWAPDVAFPVAHFADPAFVVTDCNIPPDNGGGAFWNADNATVLHLLGMEWPRELRPAPRHGYRLVVEPVEPQA